MSNIPPTEPHVLDICISLKKVHSGAGQTGPLEHSGGGQNAVLQEGVLESVQILCTPSTPKLVQWVECFCFTHFCCSNSQNNRLGPLQGDNLAQMGFFLGGGLGYLTFEA